MRSVPFYSQHWNLDDWEHLGFQSRDDAIYWQASCCGVLCLKMALDGFRAARGEMPSGPVIEFIQRGVALGAYTHELGWSHHGLGTLAAEYGLRSRPFEQATPGDIAGMIQAGALPIVSISWAFEDHRTLQQKLLFWKKYGGHLALVIGFAGAADAPEGFSLHHTSKRLPYNWVNRFVPTKKFMFGFTGRGVALSEGA